MNRSKILDTAKQYVTQDRAQQYGEPEDNFGLIARFWEVYLSTLQRGSVDAYDVALMMALMKIARATRRPESADSLIDLAGYAACAGETLGKMRVPAPNPFPAPEPPPKPAPIWPEPAPKPAPVWSSNVPIQKD